MNFVVLAAALSSVNSGLYATGRILRSMAVAGSAPAFTGVMNKRHVPAGAVALTVSCYLVGIVLNYLVPAEAFNIILNFSALGILATWAFVILAHLGYLRSVKRGHTERAPFQLPWSPVSNYVTLAFLLLVYGLLWFDGAAGKTNGPRGHTAWPHVVGWVVPRSGTRLRVLQLSTRPRVTSALTSRF